MNAAAFWNGERFLLTGNAEYGLERLKKSGFSLYDVKKTQKDGVTFLLDGKQAQKVFAIYPKTWYNREERGGVKIRSLGKTGALPLLQKLLKRVGLSIGLALFCITTAFSDRLVFSVRYIGDPVTIEEAKRVAATYGLKPFRRLDDAKRLELSSALLSLDGVAFASVKKSGRVAYVQTVASSFVSDTRQKGDMTARHDGVLRSLIAPSGEKVAAANVPVKKGDLLVSATVVTGEGTDRKWKSIVVSAMAKIECVFCARFPLADLNDDTARQVALFTLSEQEPSLCAVKSVTTERIGEEYAVTLTYLVAETWNF